MISLVITTKLGERKFEDVVAYEVSYSEILGEYIICVTTKERCIEYILHDILSINAIIHSYYKGEGFSCTSFTFP